MAIKDFLTQAETKFLAPPGAFNAGSCDKTAAAMCCWSGDRQYNDNNGRCSLGHCINQAPGDNTDLCWVEEDDGSIFPYPNPTEDNQRERDLHCKNTFEFFSILLRHYSQINPFLYITHIILLLFFQYYFKRSRHVVGCARQRFQEYVGCQCCSQ